jgi:glycosyltransferase involved in cell wall biosynthesis
MQAVALLRGHVDVSLWRQEFRTGVVPDETPYGFHLAEMEGCNVVFGRPRGNSFVARAIRRLLGFDLIHVWRNWDLVKSSDVVWTVTETEYLSVLFIPWLQGKKPPKLIANNIWIFNEWDSLSRIHKAVYGALLKQVSVIAVHSQQNIPIIRRIIPGADVRLVHFGVSSDSFPLTPPRQSRKPGPLRIFAAGGDKTRDWETLLKAFGNDDRFDVTLALRHPILDLTPYRNVKAPKSMTIPQFRDNYRSADFVVIPLVENLYSGITVALEAIALGAPVISSNTGGVPTYFGPDQVIYVPPGDPDALLRAALDTDFDARRAIVARAQRVFVKNDYTSAGHARRYVALSREILARESQGAKQSQNIEAKEYALLHDAAEERDPRNSLGGSSFEP